MMKLTFIILFLISFNKLFAQQTFYLSSNGNDNNSGTSSSLPIRTLKNIKPGNTYLFKSGDTFFVKINPIAKGSSESSIIFSSYGKGPKPILSGYKTIKPGVWKKVKSNIWQLDLGNPMNYTGFGGPDTNVAFIKVGSNIFGNRVISDVNLKAKWDFYCDKRFLYVFSNSNPSLASKSIKVACNNLILNLSDNMEISNLQLIGTGSHAIRGESVRNIVLRNLNISEIGGSVLFNTTRYGNGIELWNSATNCLIENCKITQVYDAALTMQGKGDNQYFTDVTVRNNTIQYNEQSFEFWINGFKSGFDNCKFINNYCAKAGYGWSHAVRPIKSTGVHILNYSWEVIKSDLTISGNTFKDAVSGYIYIFLNSKPLFKSYNNKIYLRSETPFQSEDIRFPLKNKAQLYKLRDIEKGTQYLKLK